MRDARASAGIVALAGGVGVAFCVFLLSFAWQNALETARRQFAYESVSIAGALRQNVAAADEISGYLASLLVDERSETAAAFLSLARATLNQHSWLRAVGYQALQRGDAVPFRLDGSGLLIQSDAIAPIRNFDVGQFLARQEVVETVLSAAGALPAGVLETGPYAGKYVMARAVRTASTVPGPAQQGEPLGLLVMIIDPSMLLGPTASRQTLGVSLISESEGVVGRQFLFNGKDQPGADAQGWVITRLAESTSVQLPSYSFRLLISKPVYWRSIEHGLLYTGLFLGAGIALLLIALAHSREAQAFELRERNVEIERQVLRQTRELAVARDEALSASRVKSDFLASMSHEIRTPLNAIIGMSELLGETQLNDEQSRYVGVFRKAGEALLSLVNDILDLSKIEAGQLTLESIEFNLRDLVEHSVDIYALKAGEKGLSLSSRVASRLPERVIGDPTRLRQVLLNLIGNATKFTERGGIAVRVDPVADSNGGCRVRISVEDTGIGIPLDKRDAIFSSFTQVDSSTTRKYGGTGLGLTICRHLVEMMGGKIHVDSTEGQGSQFEFDILLGTGAGSNEGGHTKPSMPARVLLLAAEGLEARLLMETCRDLGWAATLADSSAGAAAALAAGGEQVVLCDRDHHGEDGISLCTTLRDRFPNVRFVIMLRPASLRADLERLTGSGIAHLVKPIKLRELVGAVSGRAAGDRTRVDAILPVPVDAATPRRRLLLVEDTPDNVLLIQAFLKNQPYDIDVAENGAVGLERFRQRRYDLILMDMQMPVMDGYAATAAIRDLEREGSAPRTRIIALTAHAIREDIERCLAAGCDGHLGKPIKKAVLLQALAEATRAGSTVN